MSGGVYGGDEVGALVFDIGSHSFRLGYAGEEFPKTDLPSHVGVLDAIDKVDNTVDATGIRTKKYYIGETMITVPRAGMEIESFVRDGMIDNWDIFEQMIDYSYNRCVFSESKFHPVLFTEPANNPKQKRERLMEVMFEKYNVPAFYLVKNAVLAAFASGRTNALILDAGATHTSAIPIYDDHVVQQAVVKSAIGGNMITEQLKMLLAEQNIPIVPPYLIGSKMEVAENEPPKWEKKKNLPQVTQSYHNYMVQRVVEDLAASVLQLCDMPIDPEFAEKLPAAPYGFPCGFQKEFHGDRIKIPEGLFDLNYLRNANQSVLMSVSQVASTSCGMTDIDIRSSLYSNLVVTGGCSLMNGFVERLNHDLAHKCPATIKLRVNAAPTPQERRYGAWIGGSIVASLVSRAEYDEAGKSVIEKKCVQ